MDGATVWWKFHNPNFNRFCMIHQYDGQTDGQMDGRAIAYSALSIYRVSQKNPPCGFLTFFPKRLGIFKQFFTHLFEYDPLYTRLQIFIQLFPTMTKLCHTKRDHLAKFYISL